MKTLSKYGRVFDKNCVHWDEDHECNLMYLKCQERYFNDRLKYKGYVFLRDVYEALGFPISEESIKVGWFYNEKNTLGDNFIDFSIDYDDEDDTKFYLDFNVDGDITKHFK